MRKFGVELEVIAPRDNYGNLLSMAQCGALLREAGVLVSSAGTYTHATAEGWKVVPDASVGGGYEVVSPVLDGEDGLEQLRRVCSALREAGYTADNQCGMHVHVDCRGIDVTGIKRIVRQWFLEERNFDSFCAPHRSTNAFLVRGQASNYYCRSNLARFGDPASPDTLMRAHAAVKYGVQYISRLWQGRYFKLNMDALFRHHTIEFRQHEGTVDPVAAVEWTRLMATFVEAGMNSNNHNPRHYLSHGGQPGTLAQVQARFEGMIRRAARRLRQREIGVDALDRSARRGGRGRRRQQTQEQRDVISSAAAAQVQRDNSRAAIYGLRGNDLTAVIRENQEAQAALHTSSTLCGHGIDVSVDSDACPACYSDRRAAAAAAHLCPHGLDRTFTCPECQVQAPAPRCPVSGLALAACGCCGRPNWHTLRCRSTQRILADCACQRHLDLRAIHRSEAARIAADPNSPVAVRDHNDVEF